MDLEQVLDSWQQTCVKLQRRKGVGHIDIKARSESEIENYIDDIDALMVGPHLAYILDEVEEYKNGRDVKVILMKPEYYSTLDGAKAIDHLLEEIGKIKLRNKN